MDNLRKVRTDASARLDQQILLLENYIHHFRKKTQLESIFLIIVCIIASPTLFYQYFLITILILSTATLYHTYSILRYRRSIQKIIEVIDEANTFRYLIIKAKADNPDEVKAAYNGFVKVFQDHNPNLSPLNIMKMM